MVTPTNHIISGSNLYCAGPLVPWDYRKIFLPNIGEDQKRTYHLSVGLLILCLMVNPVLVIALRL